jgi:hypothetical protein
VFNPAYQRLYQCISHRAVHGADSPLPPIDPKIQAAIEPIQAVMDNARDAAAAVKKAFKLEKVIKRTGGKRKRYGREAEAEEGDGGAAIVEELIRQVGGHAKKVSTETIGAVNPIRDFEALVGREAEGAVRGMLERVVEFTELGEEAYWEKALGCLKCVWEWVRENKKEEEVFNEGVREVRRVCGDGFWGRVKGECMGVEGWDVEEEVLGDVMSQDMGGGGVEDMLDMI